MKLHKMKAVPTVLYGCENWGALKGRKVRTESAEMRVLRPVAEYALHDHTTNEAVRETLNVYDLLWTVHSLRHNIQRDSKRWTQFPKSIFPELYRVCE